MYRLCTFALLSFALAACAGDDRTRLVVYSPHGKEMLAHYEEQFEAANPDVNVEWIDMGGQDAYDRIRTERQNPQASLWWGGAGPAFSRAAEEGLLAAYRPSWADAVPEEARGDGDRWFGTYLTPEVITYNDRVLSPEAAPQTWDDLLDERWRDRILIRYPLASATMRTIYGAMIMRQPTVEDGYAWLARLDRNVKAYTADPTQLYLRLAREEGDVTLWNMPDTYIQSELNEYPFGYVLPPEGTPVLTDGIAIPEGAPNPEAARAFYEFVTTEAALLEQAERFYRIPVRNDLDASALPAWIRDADVVPMAIDWDRLEADGADWMRYWDENIKGRGAAYLAEQGLQ